MTDSNGEIISVQVDQANRSFFYVSHSRAPALRRALDGLGLKLDPSNAGEVVLKNGLDPDDEGEEIVLFPPGEDPNKIQDALDELTCLGGRIVREVTP